MTSQKQLRVQHRQERLARERASAAAARRDRWLRRGALAVVGVAAFPLVITAILGATGAGNTEGLASGPAPWPAETAHLRARLTTLKFPPNGDESYHIHALLHVYVDGAPVIVPADIGISAADRIESPLHTHDITGIIHIEAGQRHDFKLADFFAVWGVTFSDPQLGGYHNAGDRTVQVFANGQAVSDPASYVVHAHDNIVVAYGAPGSFPTQPPADALDGL